MTSSAAPTYAPPRRQRDDRVNLSSNELRHPALPALLRQLLGTTSSSAAARYPVLDPPVEAVARLVSRDADELALTPGSDAAVRLLLESQRDRYQGRLLLQEPNYETWTSSAQSRRWSVLRIGSPDRTARGSLEALVAVARTSAPALVGLSWPNGPAGYCPPLEQIRELRTACAEHGHALVVDACYSGFAGGFPEITNLAGPGCAVVASWSKLFGLAGARAAVVVTDPHLAHDLRAYGPEHQMSWLSLHALEHTEQFLTSFARIWAEIAAERDAVRRRLIAAGYDVPVSGGNFLHCGMESAEAAQLVIREVSERGYRVRNMGTTTGLEHCVRFTVGCDDAARQFSGEVLEDVLSEVRTR